MNKSMTILYEYHNNLYINLTNRCSSACVFCLRQTREEMDGSGSLWLEHEPSYEEVIAEFSRFDMSKYKEVIFCGFGEPTERIDVLLQVAKYVKDNFRSKIRLNTNGQGNLINERDIVPELEGLIDCISISLNNPDPVKYQEIVRSVFGEKSFDAMIDFANEAKKYVPEVILSTVDTTISKEEEAKCKEICDSIGVTYRIREFEN